MSPEMHLLDDLTGGPMRLIDAVRWLFDGDLAMMLGTLRKMQQDSVVYVHREGTPVLDWQLAAWARAPLAPATLADVATVTIDITEAGSRKMGYGSE